MVMFHQLEDSHQLLLQIMKLPLNCQIKYHIVMGVNWE